MENGEEYTEFCVAKSAESNKSRMSAKGEGRTDTFIYINKGFHLIKSVLTFNISLNADVGLTGDTVKKRMIRNHPTHRRRRAILYVLHHISARVSEVLWNNYYLMPRMDWHIQVCKTVILD